MFDFFKNLSTTELILLLVIFTVLFGGKTAMKLGRIGGESLKEIKKIKKSFNETINEDEPKENKKGVVK